MVRRCLAPVRRLPRMPCRSPVPETRKLAAQVSRPRWETRSTSPSRSGISNRFPVALMLRRRVSVRAILGCRRGATFRWMAKYPPGRPCTITQLCQSVSGFVWTSKDARGRPGGTCQGWGRGFESHRPLQVSRKSQSFSAFPGQVTGRWDEVLARRISVPELRSLLGLSAQGMERKGRSFVRVRCVLVSPVVPSGLSPR